jgi:hypothetical protein
MAISQEMASSESGHTGAESTLCGLQTHEKMSVIFQLSDSPGVSVSRSI